MSPPRRVRSVWGVVLVLAGVLLLVGLALVIASASFLQNARIEGHAMSPTLRDQDRVAVNKVVYRLRLPRRGEIVMLRYPVRPDRLFVKRVIAIEGDTIEMRAGYVHLNGARLDEPYVLPDFRSRDSWGPRVVDKGAYFVMGDRRNNSSDSRHWGTVPRPYILGKVVYRWFPFGESRSVD